MERIYVLRGVVLAVRDGVVRTVFRDGAECVFAPPRDERGEVLLDFIAAATEMGYTDAGQYAAEHEIAHHVVAWETGKEHSPIVWDAAHGVSMSLAEPDRAAEEHLVNRLQRYMQLGEPDEYGCLEAAFGARLPAVAIRLLTTARPWLRHRVSQPPPAEDIEGRGAKE